MADNFSHEEQAKRLYGLGELEREALELLRLTFVKPSAGRTLMLILSSGRRRLLARRSSIPSRFAV